VIGSHAPTNSYLLAHGLSLNADPDTLQSARVEYVPLSRHDFLRFPRS